MTQTQQLPEDIRKQIEEEAAKYFPYDLKQTIGVNRDMAIKQQAYIACATARALACIQKDEEIGRLTDKNEKLIEQLKAIQKHCRDAGVPKFKEDWILIEINKITTEALKQ